MTGSFITAFLFLDLFAETLGGIAADKAYSISYTTDGGFVIAGWTNSFGYYDDLLIVKLGGSGDLQWAKTFRGFKDYPLGVIQTQDGGYAVAGYTSIYGNGYDDALILKIAPDGSQQWAKTFGGIDYDWAFSIVKTTDGGFAVGGFAWSDGRFFILRMGSDGSPLWRKSFSFSGYYDGTLYVAQTTDGGLAGAGYMSNWDTGDNAVFILKLAIDGTLAWCKLFPYQGVVSSVSPTSDSGIVIAGYRYVDVTNDVDFMVVKTSKSGAVEWATCLGGTSADYARSVTQTADKGYVVAGETWSFGSGSADFLMLKLDSGGNIEWARLFGGTNYEAAYSITQRPDGSLGIAGTTAGFGSGGLDFLVMEIAQGGYYPNCLQDCSPGSTSPSLNETSVNPTIFTSSPSPSSTPILQTADPAINIYNVCNPVYDDISESFNPSKSTIACYMVPGGLIFVSRAVHEINLYLPDGRQVRSIILAKGQNRISLEPGVYLWQAGAEMGKAVVR